MTTLEQFLKTGQLGPLVLGMPPFEVASILGEPQEQSRKNNPLLLKYGCLQLTFWKQADQRRSQLREVAIYCQPNNRPLPDPVQMTDWDPCGALTEASFWSFLNNIRYLPAETIDGESGKELILPSGVRVSFSGGTLRRLRITLRQTSDNVPIPLSDEREPSMEQVIEMLEEARAATKVGALRAGLVIAWAGLEATLRRKALRAGLHGRIGVQPIALIRELQATQNITSEDFGFIEQMRQLRTAIAHGLAPQPIDFETVSNIIDLARRLLPEAETGRETSILLSRLP